MAIALPQHVESSACPHVDAGHVACSSRFTLGRVDEAFDTCFGAFGTCGVYQQLAEIAARRDLAEQRDDGRAIELRPTGT